MNLMLNSVSDLKELQKSVSQHSRSDVMVYHLKSGIYDKIMIVKIKSDAQ